MITRTVVTALFACLLASCGGKKVAESEIAPVADITRPPIMTKQAPKNSAEPVDPNETISYEEWLKRQDEENNNP
ncbi:hypothetical protein [Arenicella xantha]|nr:hypothetical protein [Arenicella xantha]